MTLPHYQISSLRASGAHTLYLVALAAATLCLLGCTGPVTRMGAVSAVTPSAATLPPPEFLNTRYEELVSKATSQGKGSASTENGLAIEATPDRQILHGRARIRLSVTDPNGDLSQGVFWVRFNGLNVTHRFLAGSSSRIDDSEKRLWVTNDRIRLDPVLNQRIEFFYRNSQGELAYFRYDPPACNAFFPRGVQNTGRFHPTEPLMRAIAKASGDEGLSAAWLAGLIAQESGFNSRTVSSSKAIGLTQITQLAEVEISSRFQDWPRYPGVHELSVPKLKVMVMEGQINHENEWRLDPARSILGGVAFVQLLRERWSSPEVQAMLKAQGIDPDQELTRLLLASYNSGFARVQAAITRHGKDWIRSPTLKEAHKYVNSIVSYCYAFGEPDSEEDSDA